MNNLLRPTGLGVFQEKFNREEAQKERNVEAVVIGGGVLGATIGGTFRGAGVETIIMDDSDPLSGTRACGGLVKPSPLCGLNRDQEKAALDALEALYGLETYRMVIRPLGNWLKTSVYQISMDRLFNIEKEPSQVVGIDLEGKPTIYYKRDGVLYYRSSRYLIIAAGMGCQKLLPGLFSKKNGLKAKKGVSFRFAGRIEQPFVKIWAPYKQVTVHNFVLNGREMMWAADGSAKLVENWTDDIAGKALRRIKDAIPTEEEPLETVFGNRSFHPAKDRKPCFLEKLDKHVWVATGSGKFGCVSGGFCASEIARHELR